MAGGSPEGVPEDRVYRYRSSTAHVAPASSDSSRWTRTESANAPSKRMRVAPPSGRVPLRDEKDATRFTKKAYTPKKKRQWSKVANSMLKKGYSESRAIRAANTVAGK